MNNQITFKQYRTIDLTILSVLLVLSEGLTTVATTKWFVGVPFAITTTLAFLCIGMMRWGWHAAVLPLVGGITFVIASGKALSLDLLCIYIIGNLFALLLVPFIKRIGNERLRKSSPMLAGYAALTYLAICLGRWLVSLIFVPALDSVLAYLGYDVITLLFTAVLIPSLKTVDGMLEDQKHYIIRQAEEREAEQRKKDTAAMMDAYDDPDYLDGIHEEDDPDE